MNSTIIFDQPINRNRIIEKNKSKAKMKEN